MRRFLIYVLPKYPLHFAQKEESSRTHGCYLRSCHQRPFVSNSPSQEVGRNRFSYGKLPADWKNTEKNPCSGKSLKMIVFCCTCLGWHFPAGSSGDGWVLPQPDAFWCYKQQKEGVKTGERIKSHPKHFCTAFTTWSSSTINAGQKPPIDSCTQAEIRVNSN